MWAAYYNDVIMSTMVSQITKIVDSTVYSGVDQRKHQSSASLAFVQEIHRWPVNSQHKWPVTLKMFPFDDVIMPGMILFNISHCGAETGIIPQNWVNTIAANALAPCVSSKL